MIKIFLKFFLVLIFPIATFGQQASQVSLDTLIPMDEQPKMGIQKLTPEEKEVLRQKLLVLLTAAYTKGKNDGARTQVTPTASLQTAYPQIAYSPKKYAMTGEGHWIKNNIDRGAYILLEDGTLWKIDPFDKIDASLWLKTSNITIVESTSGSLGYDYLLINTDDREQAHAKLIEKK